MSLSQLAHSFNGKPYGAATRLPQVACPPVTSMEEVIENHRRFAEEDRKKKEAK